MDVKWVKIRSWHAVKREVDHIWLYTMCGRAVGGESPSDDLPDEKSCESCLRIIARLNDR